MPLAEKISADISAKRRLLFLQSWPTTTDISFLSLKHFFK